MSASFHWGLRGLDKARFDAYARLLRLRNGGQIEEATDFAGLPDEEDPADPDDDDSVNAGILSRSDETRLKKAFLDRLSELVANEKGGAFVSAALMIEWPDRVDILVTKNNGIKEGDPCRDMLETLASSLRVIARLDIQSLSSLSLLRISD